MKPITHLLGNKIVAQRYLWFAERKLTELKMVMRLQNLEFGNRMYRLPNDSVEVFIESYLGVDKIRIAAAVVKRAPNDVEFTLPLLSVDSCTIQLTANITGNTVSFTLTTSCGYDHFLWNFGDKRYSLEQNPSHTYKTSGNYDVKVKVWIQSATTFDFFTSTTNFGKNDVDLDYNTAYSKFIAKAETSSTGVISMYYSRKILPPNNNYVVWEERLEHTYDLDFGFDVLPVLMGISSNNLNFPNFPEGGTNIDLLGDNLLATGDIRTDNVEFPVLDMTPWLETTPTVLIKPMDFLQLSEPIAGITNFVGHHFRSLGVRRFRYSKLSEANIQVVI